MSTSRDKKLEDALAFLDEKFANISKKDKKKKAKPNAKPIPKEGKPSGFSDKIFVEEIEQIKMDARVSENTIYEKLSISGADSKTEGAAVIKEILKQPKDFEEKIKSKTFLLEKFTALNQDPTKIDELQSLSQKKQKEKARTHEKHLKLSSRDAKKLGVFDIKHEINFNYERYKSMNTLWQGYIKDLMGDRTNDETICAKIVKADLHGAFLSVVNAKNKTLIGIEGILLKETRRSFQILTKANLVKIVLKPGAVFLVELSENKFVRIFGDQFVFKPSERTKVKFKERYIQDLI